MADDIELAQQHEQMRRDIALLEHAHRRRTAAGQGIPEGVHCVDCTEAIEPDRLVVLPHTPRCSACAHQEERRQRHGRI